uniref:Replication termination factor 2 n=1 Tax=Plectus sambesii TaxID=2011161 RepID=A0A914X887_9BILA
MGADGGTIPKRCELVKSKKRVERIERDLENVTKWRMCQMTQEPLRLPIVSCPLGRLFNKETLIEALITKTLGDNDNTKHIKSIKDVKELKLAPNPAFDRNFRVDKGDAKTDYNISPFICPIVGLEMNGNHRFVLNWECGCVVSEKAVKELQTTACCNCGKKCDKDVMDMVVLNGTDEEVDMYRMRLEERRAAEKTAKSAKKAAKVAQVANDAVPSSSSAASAVSSGVKSTAPKSHKAPAVGDKRKLGAGVTADSQSIQDDPKASKTYKSLFTTCEVAKNKPAGHWVTYNPLFY